VELSRLSAIPFFTGLDDADLAVIAGAASELDAATGDALVTEGDFGHALYAIETGTADVVAGGSLLATLGPGDVFGEIAVVASGRRTATVTATSPMRLIVLFKRDVWALERRAPAAAKRLRELIAERQIPAS
jgi:CRP/FNR family transcriptional regulator, cyclic AMP receptor protein